MKNESGITLTMLVVTMIVIIIIAGVGVKASLDRYSIIQESKDIKSEYEERTKSENEEYQNIIDEFHNTENE